MKKWRLDFRIWHWVHAFVVLALLSTVFLRKTFLSWRSNSEILASKLLSMDVNVSSEQAKILAKAVRAPMWEWHILFGYALALLLLIRVILFFTKSGKQNYININTFSLHKKLVKFGYIGIYTVLAFMSISGLILVFYKDLGLLKETAHNIKEVHEAVFNLVWVFVLLHIGGLVVAEQGDDKGIISDMIHGGKQDK